MKITTINIGNKKVSGWNISSQDTKNKKTYFVESTSEVPFGQRLNIISNDMIDNIEKTINPVEVTGEIEDIYSEEFKIPQVNTVVVNPKNLNPILIRKEPEQINFDRDIVILTLSSDIKFVRNIVCEHSEIINTFHNVNKDYGCIIRYKEVDSEQCIIKVEVKKGDTFYHISINLEQGNVKLTQNVIKKPAVIKQLTDTCEKKKYNGFKVESDHMLCSTIICLEEDDSDVNKFLDIVPTDENVQEFTVYKLEDLEQLEQTKHVVQETKIRCALIWNLNKFDYEKIKGFKFLYIFTNIPNSKCGIKNLKSN